MNESQIFKAVVALPDEKQAVYLDLACGADSQLRKSVESLLSAHRQGASFLEESPLAGASHATTEYRQIAEGPGSIIGPYRLMELVGEGGFGLVFVAKQQEPIRRKVALKIIKPGMDTKEIIGRFEAERQALALMDHPNIAKVLDAGTTDSGRPYFVMELIRGVPIVDYCDTQELTTRARLRLFVDVCRAVQHAHAKGIIHRDLKPSNILVSPHDGVPVVKIIDFGIAKAIGQQLTDKTVYTRLTQMIGTPLYMSPEQAEVNALDVDIRSDVYSLGVVLYELLTGTTPFDKDRFSQAAYEEIKRIIREEEPLTPSKRLNTLGDTLTTVSKSRNTEPTRLAASLRGELDWIAMCCLEKDRSRRYQTALELVADVERYLGDEPVAAVPPSSLYKAKKFTRRYRVPIAIMGSFVLLALVFVALLVRSESRARATLASLRSVLLDRAFNASVIGDFVLALEERKNAHDVGVREHITETLKGISYSTAGETHEAVLQLEKLMADRENYLARIALVWIYYESGEIAKAEQLYEQLRESRQERVDIEESDFEQLLLARLTTYAPGRADEQAIDSLTKIIERHRLWGFAYFARAEAYRDKLLRTKKIEDLQSALNDDRIANVLLPHSDTVKSNSLVLHLHAYQFAKAFTGIVDDVRCEQWRGEAESIASHFSATLSNWDGAAGALAYYRATKQNELADALEGRIEKKFAALQPIRDLKWFETRDFRGFESMLKKEAPYTKHIYALALFEAGKNDRALTLIEETIQKYAGNADVMSSALEILLLMQEFDRCKELARNVVQAKDSWELWEWPPMVVAYFAGEKTESELLAMAGPFHFQVCLARYAIGISCLARGDRETAIENFQAVVDTGRIGWGAYGRAKAFLRRMKENPEWPEWIQSANTDSQQ